MSPSYHLYSETHLLFSDNLLGLRASLLPWHSHLEQALLKQKESDLETDHL